MLIRPNKHAGSARKAAAPGETRVAARDRRNKQGERNKRGADENSRHCQGKQQAQALTSTEFRHSPAAIRFGRSVQLWSMKGPLRVVASCGKKKLQAKHTHPKFPKGWNFAVCVPTVFELLLIRRSRGTLDFEGLEGSLGPGILDFSEGSDSSNGWSSRSVCGASSQSGQRPAKMRRVRFSQPGCVLVSRPPNPRCVSLPSRPSWLWLALHLHGTSHSHIGCHALVLPAPRASWCCTLRQRQGDACPSHLGHTKSERQANPRCPACIVGNVGGNHLFSKQKMTFNFRSTTSVN